jgi:hypothetical protein
MVIAIDSLGPEGKRRMVIATTTVGLVCSISTYILRTWARLSTGRMFIEDWVMGVALFLSFGFAICNFYGTIYCFNASSSLADPGDRFNGRPGRA